MQSAFSVVGYVTTRRTTLQMAALRFPRKVLAVHVEVIEAFNSNGTDTLVIGHTTDPDAYATSIDVSTTGIKSVTLGAGVGFDTVERALLAAYTAGGSTPTTGIIAIIVEFVQFPPQP